MRILIFGIGYVAQHWIKHLKALNHTVHGTTRSPARQKALSDAGIIPHIFGDDLAPIIATADAILITHPPMAEGDATFQTYAESIRKRKTLTWLGYLSSTAVYGNHDAKWVDENTPRNPTSQDAIYRALAEDQWHSLFSENKIPVHIFRVAGIYGPGQSQVDRIIGGTARRIDKPGHVMNRIHITDLCSVLTASLTAPHPGEIYNVADNQPASTREVIEYLCQKLNADLPPLETFEAAALPQRAAQFYAENKRVRNTKILHDLGVKLTYPTYKLGYEQILNT